MPRTPPDVSPERPRFITTPVHRCSRRQLGLPPEYGALFESEPTREDPGPGVMAQPVPTSVVLQQPREPTSFRGAHEDVEDWLEQFERVATFNQWSATEKLRQVYYSLADGARTWYENREGRIDTWGDFCREIKESFANADRRDHAQRLLDARFQKPNETVSMFAEDMARLFRRADPDMAESKKVRYLMHGVKEQLFAGLVRNPPSTVDEFVREATAIERALRQRSRQYDRHAATPQSSISALLARDDDNLLRDLIRVVLREELVKCGIIPSAEPAQACVANIVRQEIRNALSVPVAEVEPPRQMSYATALTCQAPARPTRPAAPTLPYPPPRPDDCWPQQEPPPRSQQPFRPRSSFRPETQFRPPQVRKTDLWRTADNRPLCYHCGEPGHVYRRCPYREIGLPGFPPTAIRPQVGERPAAISEYLAERRATAPFRRSRSQSPAPYTSPSRHTPGDRPTRRSPTPPRGN